MKYTLGFTCITLFAMACNNTTNTANTTKTTTSTSTTSKADLLASHLNDSVAPSQDFFTYANGGWLKAHPIPASESGWGIFNLVADENYTRIRKISEDASANTGTKGTASQLIGDFFSAGMDSASVEKQDISVLKTQLEAINNAKTISDIADIIYQLQQSNIAPLYNFGVGQDLKNSNKNMLYFNQGGLGLPDRDYYFNTDAPTIAIRNEYKKHLGKILAMTNGTDSANGAIAATDVLNIETTIAKKHRKLEALRDPEKNYTKMSLADFGKKCPNINWQKQMQVLQITVDSVIVGQPEFYTAISTILNSTPVAAWKNYLKFHLVSSMSPYLSTRFANENYNFYSKILSGTKEQRPRWKRVLDAQENALGDALGQLFVKEYFPAKTKTRYEDLVNKIIETYAQHIKNLTWMGDITKQKALVKLNAITKKIGYPSTWKDYSKMDINRTSYAQNVWNANLWRTQYDLAKLAKPVDRTQWDMTPQTYNAYYNPSNNEIVLPAAMFTAPGYTDDELDDALVYGYVGASTIGHELTHGFDDEGRKYDEKGNLKNWWTAQDEKQFMQKATMLVKQFDTYTVLGTLHPNGKASLGENIADLGGVVVGYDAFTKTKQYQENKNIGGLTPSQRFFLGYAYGWMQVRRPEKVAQQILTDVHAPINLRVNGPMSNCDAWYKTFNIQKGTAMWRDSADRVRIW